MEIIVESQTNSNYLRPLLYPDIKKLSKHDVLKHLMVRIVVGGVIHYMYVPIRARWNNPSTFNNMTEHLRKVFGWLAGRYYNISIMVGKDHLRLSKPDELINFNVWVSLGIVSKFFSSEMLRAMLSLLKQKARIPKVREETILKFIYERGVHDYTEWELFDKINSYGS